MIAYFSCIYLMVKIALMYAFCEYGFRTNSILTGIDARPPNVIGLERPTPILTTAAREA
jgi:hypothetical protein